MNKIIYFFLVNLLLGNSFLIGQEYALQITVKDSETREPLNSVNVIIENSKGGGITDLNGVISFKLPVKDHINSFKYLGYKSEKRIISLINDSIMSMYMEVLEEKLSEIIVKAQKLNKNIQSPLMGVLNITAKDLVKIPSAFGEFDILKSMTMMAGVNNAGDVSNGISVRGGSLDQNLILYESAPVFNPTHLFGLLSVFTPDVISSVSMFKANIPSKYGGRISSVLDIKVKNPYVDKLKINGGFGLLSSRLNLTTPLIKNKLFLSVGARSGFTDFLFPIFIKRLEKTKANFFDGTGKILYLLNDDNQLSYTFFKSNDFYQLDLISSIENINSEVNQFDFKTTNHSLSWIHNFKNNTSFKSTIVNSLYTPKNLFPEYESNNVISFKSNLKYTSTQQEFIDSRNEKIEYYLGFQTKKYTIQPGALSPGNGNSISPISLKEETSFDFSGYFNLDWTPNEKVSISVGIRHTIFNFLGPYNLYLYDENYKQTGVVSYQKNKSIISYNNFEPRFGARINIGENSSFKASYSRINQYIQNIYNTSTPLPTSRWKTSDFYIKPQISDTYSLGFFQNLNSLGVEFSAESYYRDSENSLSYKPGANFFLSDFVERDIIQGKGRTYGIEIALKKKSNKFNGFINYTWARSLLKTDEKLSKNRINNNNWYASEFDRPHTLNATISYGGDLYNEFGLNFTAQSGKPYTIANGVFNIGNLKVPIYLERNNATLPVYHRLDFSSIGIDNKKKTKVKTLKNNDMIKQLNDLKKLLDEGVITQDEFTKAKKKILN